MAFFQGEGHTGLHGLCFRLTTGFLGELCCSCCTHVLLNVKRFSSSTYVNGCVVPSASLHVAVQEFLPNRIHCILRMRSAVAERF